MKKIKLSDAIERGGRLRGKNTGELFKDNKSCALGAAYEYVFDKLTPAMLEYSDEDKMYFKLRGYWPELKGRCGCTYEPSLENHIITMNDDYGFTRLQIAQHLRARGF